MVIEFEDYDVGQKHSSASEPEKPFYQNNILKHNKGLYL